MIRYQKVGVDPDVIRLLSKLGENYPLASLLLDIENNCITVNKVFYNNALYGILVLRGVINRNGLAELVCNHVIAEDGIDTPFNSILAQTLPEHAAQAGFDKIRVHVGRAGLRNILEKWAGEPKEFVYEKDIRSWKTAAIANHQQHSRQHPHQQTPE